MEWLVSQGVYGALALLVAAFVLLVKCADWMVEGAADLARRLRLPPILIGIVIVSVGTTAPELAVSVQAALAGKASIALGNAVGSVIYDDGIALPLVALLSPIVVVIDRVILRSAALFLIIAHLGAYWMCADGTLARVEGAVLVCGFFVYLAYAYWEQRRGHPVMTEEVDFDTAPRSWGATLGLLAGGLAGVLVSSDGIVRAAPVVATAAGVSDVIIALVVIALGTSIPEIATCVAAARKRQGSLAVGNILGADILNICWIAGASATVQDLVVPTDVIHFMFPAMLIIVFTMLGLMRWGHRFERWKGVVLLVMCCGYIVAVLIIDPGGVQAAPPDIHPTGD
ncbi:MAG: calcium/sodium antiporter [Candidatus Latescibacteria bacterium]|nr:calcium/sodium antiporter [Candidatus Latescibacterota bacterium]MDP7448911.1 calcium/sodium antiporter [Candidatus Latescibacterota bacterium]HJP33377.1 calcium/sodium antiporter [Candidatus Latescibacterota bacterium]